MEFLVNKLVSHLIKLNEYGISSILNYIGLALTNIITNYIIEMETIAMSLRCKIIQLVILG